MRGSSSNRPFAHSLAALLGLALAAPSDPETGAVLTDPLADGANTGEISVANGPSLDSALPREIAGTDFLNEGPVDEVLSANTVQENAADGTVVGAVTGSDPDAGAVLTYSLTDDAGGRFAIDAASGVITVANGNLLDFEAASSHGISVRVSDEGGLFFDKDFTIAVTDVNEAPVAVGDHVTTNEDTALVLAASALTANDGDPDGDVLTVTAVGNATHGTVSLVDGNITFTPDANFSGIARFDYTASDGRGGSTTATVTVDVAPVADAPTLQATQFMHAVRKSAGEFLVNTATLNGQLNPSVTALTNGNFVVTWEDNSGQGGDAAPASIKAQIFNAAGAKVGGEFLVNTATASTQRFPSVTGLTNGSFVVTWEDSSGAGGDASGDSIKAQVFDATGAKVGGEVLVNTATANSQANPSITALTNGGFVVAWEDNSLQGGDASGTSIKAQMFDASGAKVGGEVLVNTTTQNGQIAPAITALAGGGFVATWSDASGQGGDASGFGIKAQLFNATGGKAGGEFLVNTATLGDQSTPSITALSTGGFIVAWNDGSGQGGDASSSSIKAQIFNAAGGKVGGEKLVNTITLGPQRFPSITALSNGWFVVTWEDSSGVGGDASFDSIKAQVYDGNGAAIGVEFLVNTTTVTTQVAPSVAALANGSFVVTWQDQSGVGGDTSAAGIKAQIFALASTNEDTPMSLSVTSALTDTDGSETLALAVSSIPVGATLSDGVHTFTATAGNTSADISGWTLSSLTLTPPLNFNGDFQLTFTATATDTATLSTGAASSTHAVTQTINVSVTPVNDAPVAVADHFTASEDTPLNIPMALLTGNDTDVDGDVLTVTTDGTATHGSTVISNGIVTFRPTANYSGIAQFTYTVSDGQGGSATATATVDVAPVADSPTLQASAVGAQRIGGEFLVNTRTVGDQANPSITALANGNFVVTWDDNSGQGGDASGAGIKAQILDAAGSKVGGEFLVNTVTASSQFLSSVAALTSGGFIVAWSDISGVGGDTSGLGVKAQIFDAAGSKVGGEFLVNTTTVNNQSNPSVTGLTNGNFVVTWEDSTGDASSVGVKAQIFNATGGKVGGEFLVNTATLFGQNVPSIKALADGAFVVTWDDSSGQGGDASGGGIKAQIFDATGAHVGGEFLVNTTTLNSQANPSVTVLSNGNFVVTWEDGSGQGGDASGLSTKAQIFNASGGKVGSEFRVNTTTLNSQSVPSITALTNGSFVVTWEDASGQGGDASPDSIKAQVFDASGNKQGGEFLVNTATLNSQRTPSITALANGAFVVTWADASAQGGDTSGFGIKAQIFMVATDNQNTLVPLNVAAALTDTDGSETLAVTASSIPVGAILTDGVHTFTASTGSTSVDITSWALINLGITPPPNFAGNLQLAFSATATDHATLSTGAASDTKTVTQTVNVNVLPVNGVTDEVLSANTVQENAANGTVVGTVTGADLNPGAVLTYALTNDAGGRFAIDAATGVITVANGSLLDFETATSHGIAVQVTDQFGFSFNKLFTVNLTNVNEAPANEVLSGGTVAENASNNTVVGTVTGSGDPDAGAVLTYSLTDNAGGRFAINATSGVITVANGTLLNFETAISHGITARVTDQGGLFFDKNFTITVSNVNEAPTNEVLTDGTVAENAANGTVVGTVTGSDQDAGSVLTYSLTNNAGGRFAINATSGVITVANGTLLNFEASVSQTIGVRVTDQGGLFFDKNFTIAVTNVNEAPTNEVLSFNQIAENAANGAVVGTVTGSDPDAGGVLTYSLTDNAGGRFAINANTGQITVANGTLLNFETATSHGITARVTDQGGLFFDKNFTINVSNVNEAPTNEVLTDGTVAENAANGTVVGTITGSGDPDAGAVLTYSLTDNAGGRFAINANTGVITVANGALLNFEAAPSQTITARVSDQGGLFFDKNFTITVSNVNEAPTNEVLSFNQIAENAANGAVVGTVTGSGDPDAGAVLTYSLTNDAGGRFAINATTGVITVANGALLDFDTAPSQTITARVTDQGGLFFDKSFTIALTNVNEAPTNAVLSGSGTIAENAANGSVVGTVTGSDPDAGSVLTYTLLDNAGGRFAVNANTGVITVANGTLLNFETAPSHGITARVTDQGGLFFDKNFTITVSNVNEAPTDAVLDNNTVQENSPAGRVVGTVTGVDPDAGSVLTYALTNNAGGRFAIDATTGVITVATDLIGTHASLDFELAKTHDVTVQVTDQGGLSFTKTLTINVVDVNERPTDELLSANTVQVDAANGTVIGTVTSIDPDVGEDVLTRYTIVDSQGNPVVGGPFAIDPATGVLTVADRTQLATAHQVTVRATDKGFLTFDKTFPINVTSVKAVADHFTTNEDTPLVIPGPIMTANDIDPNHRATVTAVGNASHGTVVVSNGVVTFTPDAHYSGAAQFDYTISDGQGGTSTATDTIDVAPNLKAVADHIGAREDGPVLLSAASLTANDTNTGGALTLTAVGNASHGTVALVNGDVHFTPDHDFSGIAQFDYTVNNAQGDTSTATVTLDVAPIADDPTLSVHQIVGAGEPGNAFEMGVSSGIVLGQTVVATLKNGDCVAVWFDSTDQHHADTLKAQMFDSNGHERGGAFVVEIAPSGTGIIGMFGTGLLVALSNGGFAVTWADISNDATTLNAKIFDANGHETAGIIPIAARSRSGIGDLFTTFQSATLTNDRFVVEWVMTERFDDETPQVMAQVFGSDGGAVSGQILLDQFAKITGLANGRFVTVWSVSSQGTVENRAQIYDGNGTKIGGEILLSQGGQGFTLITASNAGGFLAWNGSTAQLFDSIGTKIGGELHLGDNSISVQSITALANGNYVVGGIKATGPLTESIIAQVFNRSGQKVGEFAIPTGFGVVYSTNSIAALPDGGFVVGWSDEELSPSGVRLHNRVQIFPPAAATAAAMNTPVPVNVAAALTDTDGSETLKVEVSGIPVGTTLSDGTHTFTVTDGRASVDISDWSFGSLTVTPPLDFRGDLQVTFTATSTDTATLSTGPASDTTSVTQIIDILIAPEGSLDHNTVAENSPNGTVVGAFIPDVSPDVAAGFTYELVNDAGGRFALSGNVISVANNDLIDATYTVTVRTTNPADGTTFDNSVTINVNRAPTGATVVGGSIAASDMDGHMVATVTGIDPDPGDSLVYSLVDNIFAIDPTLGIITLIDREALDFNLTSYVVTVRITDQFQQSVLVPVTLTLEPDQAPTGATLDTNTVDDNAKQGDAVVRVQGSDPDIMDTLIYDFADGGDAGGLFDIDRATGIITVANEALLAATTASSVGIIVRVSDGLRSVDQHLTIHVNHAPALVTLSNDTVRTAENGASVAQVIGLDFDGDTLHYAFVNNDGGTSALSADGTYAISANGVITVNDATLLDGSPKDVVVRTMDPRGRFVDDHFTIKDDTNHAPTGASLPDFTVPDNAPNGTPVGTVVGEDPDNDVLHYAFVDNTGGTSALSADGTFAISANGVITVNDGTLLNEAAKDIIVRITDPHGLSFDQPLTIIVTGHSDTPSLQAPASELSGGSGEGVVNGTAGNDTLSGGGGSDTYVFGSGFGQTTIHNLAQDGLTVPHGEIDFGTGVSNQNLWFEQKGNDLQIDRIGTQSHITVAGWYGSDPRAQVQSINAPDGSLLNSQVQQLVSAMAAYVGSHPGFDPTTATQAPQGDANLQAAIGAAWHH